MAFVLSDNRLCVYRRPTQQLGAINIKIVEICPIPYKPKMNLSFPVITVSGHFSIPILTDDAKFVFSDYEIEEDKTHKFYRILGLKVRQASVGKEHLCIVTENDEVYVAGNPKFIGINAPDERWIKLTKMQNVKVRSAMCGKNHIAFIDYNYNLCIVGNVLVNPKNIIGERYKNNTFIKNINFANPIVTNRMVKELKSCHGNYFIDEDGYLQMYSAEFTGELSFIKQIDIKVKNFYRVKNAYMLIDESGDAYAWGNNFRGSLGVGTCERKIPFLTPVNTGGIKVKLITMMCSFTLFCLENNEVCISGSFSEDKGTNTPTKAFSNIEILGSRSEIRFRRTKRAI